MGSSAASHLKRLTLALIIGSACQLSTATPLDIYVGGKYNMSGTTPTSPDDAFTIYLRAPSNPVASPQYDGQAFRTPITWTYQSGNFRKTASGTAGWFSYDNGYSGLDLRASNFARIGDAFQLIMVFPPYMSGYSGSATTPMLKSVTFSGQYGGGYYSPIPIYGWLGSPSFDNGTYTAINAITTENRFAPNQKASLQAISDSLQLIGYGLGAATLYCNIAVLPCTAASGVAGILAQIASFGVGKLADDPIDLNYKQIAQPIFNTLPDLGAFGPVGNALAQVLAYSQAIQIAVDRDAGAQVQGDVFWVQQQQKAIELYLSKMTEALDQANQELLTLSLLIEADGISFDVTDSIVAGIQQQVVDRSFNDPILAALNQLDIGQISFGDLFDYISTQDTTPALGLFSERIAFASNQLTAALADLKSVPEPSSVFLVLVGLAALTARRRRQHSIPV